jgi:hypothetical protein
LSVEKPIWEHTKINNNNNNKITTLISVSSLLGVIFSQASLRGA